VTDRLYQLARSIFHHLVSSSIRALTSHHLLGFLKILIMTSVFKVLLHQLKNLDLDPKKQCSGLIEHKYCFIPN